METARKFQLDGETKWETVGEGIERKLFGYGHRLMMVKVRFQAGGVGEPHNHPHTQASYVESGVFELTIDGEIRVLRQGDGYFVAPHLVHGCKCLEAGVLIDVFTPEREDFL